MNATAQIFKAASKQNAMSAYMVDNAIPLKEELARREKLCAMTPKARLQAWWHKEVSGRAWELEFTALWDERYEGDENERRRDELIKCFISPYPNYKSTDTPNSLTIYAGFRRAHA